MSAHLSPREFVDAVDGVLPADRLAHVSTCATCEREVSALAAVTSDARAAGRVPEPSPLFWHHFSERVREATAAEPIVRPRWWEISWRPLAALATVAGAVALFVFMHGQVASPPAAPDVIAEAAVSANDSATDDGSVDLVAGMAEGLSTEELHQATHPTPHAVASAIEDLTPAQRAAFLRLIKAEMGDSE